MKAIHIPTFLPASTPYSSLKPIDLPSPTPSSIPSTHVLVSITHTTLNHVDLLYSRGLHQNNHSGLVKPPFNLGLEFAGIVAYVPAKSTSGWKVGDRVWGGTVGSHATEVVVPATSLRRVPGNVSLLEAAGIGAGSATVSYGALMLCAKIKKGETVLVHAAAGGLGVGAVQIASALGCRVIGTVGSEGKKEALMKNLGDEMVGVVNYSEEGWEKRVVKMAGGEGVDVVYDTVGLVLGSIRCVKFNGRIVIAGFAGREGKMEQLPMNRVLLKNVQLLGYRYGESGRRNPGSTEECWRGVEKLMTEKKLKAVTYKVYKGLESVGAGMEELKDRKVWGKAVVEVQSEKEAANLKGRL